MKFTLSWLKEHLATTATLADITAKLTALGLEVEEVADRAAQLAPFTIARIVSAEMHPNADRLRVCVVDNGKEKINVVCGAPNARTGLVGVFAPVGTFIPGSDITLKKGNIRGAESNGMMCSAAELQLSEESDGIIELPTDAPIGQPYAPYARIDDPVITIKLTPNRPDCAGVRGIARDLAAAGLGTLQPLEVKPIAEKGSSLIQVSLDFAPEAKAACPHFVGRHIRGVKNGPSPEWLQRKLRAIGLRPISALVDITNLLTYDLSRPLHVFDAQKLHGNLTLRFARTGEKLAALNDKTYDLSQDAVVIADNSGPVSLGGIMGGISTGCDDATTEVFLEAAYFDPARVARTGRQLQITSDARYRFERGIDPAFTQTGAELATQLILELCGTSQTTVSPLVIAGASPVTKRETVLRVGRCAALAGVEVPVAEQVRILAALGFAPQQQGDKIQTVAPSWRPDIVGEADLVEEIIRVHGFEHIPATSLPRSHVVASSAVTVPQRRSVIAKRALAAQGLLEVVTWSFMPAPQAALFRTTDETVRLQNPISSELDMMRPSILANLLDAARRNADRGFADIGLFEVGPVYHGVQPEAQKTVATLLRAGQTTRHWSGKPRAADVFDAKADALAVLAACGVNTDALQITADAPGYYHPGQSGCLRQGNNVLASFGALHPSVQQALDVKQGAVGAEIWLDGIPVPKSSGTAKPALLLPPLQAVARDFAFVVDEVVTADKIIKAIKQVDKNLITAVEVFDVYAGSALGAGKKSLALSVTLQPRDQTLTDEQLEQLGGSIVSAVAKATGGTLRT
ncbi:MAG: phenylalanine--tRNA ligase subunit beta [Alphaproteobacteria bacterium]|nr:phenylalanine--tRNA ligase subunit beta [Alphaproteobacteria bacterium]